MTEWQNPRVINPSSLKLVRYFIFQNRQGTSDHLHFTRHLCLPRSCQRGTGEFKFCGPGCLASVGFKPSVFKANCPFTKQTLVLLLWKIYVLILKVSKYGWFVKSHYPYVIMCWFFKFKLFEISIFICSFIGSIFCEVMLWPQYLFLQIYQYIVMFLI